ncbi:MAG TPA: sulfatase [Thermoanaerobaculia bacterium]|jgi:arylsulfatase A-like enzyme|nr:sulfatase [Thermoanaerobaculia bacterium]
MPARQPPLLLAVARARQGLRRLALPLLLALTGACGGPPRASDYAPVATLQRELSVAVASGPRAAAEVAARCEALARRQGGVFIPYGARLTLYAELPSSGALRLTRLARCGQGEGRLLVRVATDRRGDTRAMLVPVPLLRVARLPPEGGVARLELAAVPAEARQGHAGGGLLLSGLALGARGTAAAAAAAAEEREAAWRARRRPLNVLIYLVDALRRDGLGCYGGRRGVSPHLDRFAAGATVFDDAVAQGSWTRPAVASLLTGLTPASHGVLGRHDALAESATTLAERLHAAGYRTASLVANVNVSGRIGFRQGNDFMRQLLGELDAASTLTGELERWLDTAASDRRPFFAYLHTIEPHGSYDPPEPFRSRFAAGVPPALGTRRALRRLEQGAVPLTPGTARQLRALYDAEVATNDQAFGDLRAWLERRGLWGDTVVVVLADHGEEFFEHHGWEHGGNLHAETLSIPLLVRVPGLGAGRRVATLAQQVDLVPTLLELAGQAVPVGLDGGTLLPQIAGAEPPLAAPARSYQRLADRHEAAVTSRDYRLIAATFNDGSTRAALYDRRRDPGERRDLLARLPITAAYLRSVLRWPQAAPGTLVRPAGKLGAEGEQQLRALGYAN